MQCGSTESTAGRSSRMKGSVRRWARSINKRIRQFMFKISMRLGTKTCNTSLKRGADITCHMTWVQGEELGVKQLKSKKELFTKATQNSDLTSIFGRLRCLKTKDRGQEPVVPQHMGFAMKLVRNPSSWAIAERPGLKYDYQQPPREWSSQREQACELFTCNFWLRSDGAITAKHCS